MNTEFDRFAGRYEELLKDPLRKYFAPGSNFFVTRKLEVLLAVADEMGLETRHATWVDVGCGKGSLLRAGRSAFTRAIGCDLSVQMVRDCHDLDVVLQTEDDQLPFEDASADWVTAVCVYHHVNPQAWNTLTAEVWRVLRPGGIFAMIEHNPLNPVTRLIVRRTPVDEHAILLTARSARRLVRNAGLRVAGTRYFLYVPEQVYRWGRFMEKALERVPLGGQYAVFGVKPNAPV